MTTSPTFPSTPTERLIALRDIAWPRAMAEIQLGRLNLDVFAAHLDCGTIYCLLGWYVVSVEGVEDTIIALSRVTDRAGDMGSSMQEGDCVFGLSSDEYKTLFTTRRHRMSIEQDMDKRLAVLNEIIAKRLAENPSRSAKATT